MDVLALATAGALTNGTGGGGTVVEVGAIQIKLIDDVRLISADDTVSLKVESDIKLKSADDTIVIKECK